MWMSAWTENTRPSVNNHAGNITYLREMDMFNESERSSWNVSAKITWRGTNGNKRQNYTQIYFAFYHLDFN